MSDPLRDKMYVPKCFQLSVVRSRERQQAEQERYSQAAEVPAHLSCLQLKYPNFFFPSEWWPFQPLLILHGNLVLPHRVPEVLFCPCCPVAQGPNPGCGSRASQRASDTDRFQHWLTGIQKTDYCPSTSAFCWMQIPPGAAHTFVSGIIWFGLTRPCLFPVAVASLIGANRQQGHVFKSTEVPRDAENHTTCWALYLGAKYL